MSRWTKAFHHTAHHSSCARLVSLGLLIRVGVWIALSISCAVGPDGPPLDDSVVVLDLRLRGGPNDVPFALVGSFCECGFLGRPESVRQRRSFTAAAPVPVDHRSSRWRRRLWSWILTPLTRWDAARFLQLAHDPTLRNPQVYYQLVQARATTLHARSSCPSREAVVVQSEQAHAFLPLFPGAIQLVAQILVWLIPSVVLPPTCEGVLVLSAWILNTVCTVWAARELYHLTHALLVQQLVPTKDNDTAEAWAKQVMLLFFLHPATVFGSVAYSETLGAALLWTACRWWTVQTSTPDMWHRARCRGGAVVLVWLACGVRSNAILYVGFGLLYGLGTAVRQPTLVQRWGICVVTMALGLGVYLTSLVWHNVRGVHRHCTLVRNDDDDDDAVPSDACDGYTPPDWCRHGPWFNVYSYVQQRHWNVGLFRYYQWKQLPNFLLAAPVLGLSTWAVATWISLSWHRFQRRRTPKGHIVSWALVSLHDFASASTRDTNPESILVGSPLALGHYAVLAASVLLCLTVAHVQIATRLIFSTCPALYWFLVTKLQHDTWGTAILTWCWLYTILGIILHPNWLPWT